MSRPSPRAAPVSPAQTKRDLLTRLAKIVEYHASSGQLVRRTPIRIAKATVTPGLRVGALELHAGLESDRMIEALTRRGCALLRPLVPWPFPGEPIVQLAGPAIRIEIAWPDNLAIHQIALSRIRSRGVSGNGPSGNAHSQNDPTWTIGVSQWGEAIGGELSDRMPHWLVVGSTGSGKSIAVESLIAQLARHKDLILVLVDAKGSRVIQRMRAARGVWGPIARDVVGIRAALAWSVRQMADRFAAIGNDQAADPRPLVVVIDELADVVKDNFCATQVELVATKGREANVHLVAATQYSTVDALGGPQIARNLLARVALHVPDQSAAQVTAQGLPAHQLLMAGDAYVIYPDQPHVRIQVAMLDDDVVVPTWRPPLDDWPAADLELPARWPHPDEIAHSIISATQIKREGRGALARRFAAAGVPVSSAERMQSLVQLGREVHAELNREGLSVCSVRPEPPSECAEMDILQGEDSDE
jgi:hypothetical protein